jgi:hypothetical protein
LPIPAPGQEIVGEIALAWISPQSVVLVAVGTFWIGRLNRDIV